ncbi:MAG: DUF3857 domain-containing protein, partial [Candidatus Omnitrophica bacterium]|nr:DUF3857 domain-containing protein [Candidatus Omnitrophota bacterium]
MRIIDMDKNSKSQLKIKNFGFYFVILMFTFCILYLLSGCTQKDSLEKAENYIGQAQDYYQRAEGIYKAFIAKGDDLDRLHFALGQLYYNQGKFKQAIEEFRESNDSLAKKFLAVSYYRFGNFTDALEVFNKHKIIDDEYLYYYGLTCEKLNLYDQALDIYKKIKAKEFAPLASERLNFIEKQVSLVHIKDINPEVNKILLESPSEDEYPQAGALILYCDEKIEITPENTQVSYIHYIIKILNERGKEDFAESHINYDCTFEKVELEYARTIKPDGTVVEVGSRHIRDVSKYLNFPLYSNARVFIISFPEIAEGAVVEYKAKIYRSQLINKKDFVISYPLQSAEPIIDANLTIDLPQTKDLYIKTINEKYNYSKAVLKPKIQKKDNRLIYNWQFNNIPQILPESNMPPGTEINPSILISTFNQWRQIYDWWWPLAKDKIGVDSAIKDKIKELTAGLVSDAEKAKAIYNFCAQKIRYVAVEYGQAGYEPHSACDIFKNKYGDCKDQAILLVAMLREAGFDAWPVLISTKDYYNLNEDFPSVQFNHCIACVSLDNEIVFLDPTAETCPFGDLPIDDQGRKTLVFKNDGYQIQDTPLYPAHHNLLKECVDIKINSDETITAKRSIFTYGIYDQAQRFWLLYTPPELVEETIKEKIQEISIGARLDSYVVKNLNDLNTPLELSYVFNGTDYCTLAGPLRIMPELSALDTSLVAKDKRKYAIDFDILNTKETILEFEIPDNFAIRYLPQCLNADSPWLEFSVEYNRKDNKIYFREKIELKK